MSEDRVRVVWRGVGGTRGEEGESKQGADMQRVGGRGRRASGAVTGGFAAAKLTISRPSALYAGEARILGTQVERKASALAGASVAPTGHWPVAPELQSVGATKEKLGVFSALRRSAVSWSIGRSLAEQSPRSSSEWK